MLRSSILHPGRCLMFAGVTAVLGACSVHPLPEDVSRVSTFDIVEKLRCEAKEGIQGLPSNDPFYSRIVANSFIGYDFEFEITEQNNLGGDAPGKLAFARRAAVDGKGFFLDITGSATRTRSNKRTFRILESLRELQAADCSRESQVNWVYPITGRVGLDEVVRTYIKLEALTDIGKKDNAATLDSRSIIFSDELKFTTNLGGGIKPTLELSTVAGRFKLTNASIFAQASREDKHGVTISLARETGDFDPRRVSKSAFRAAQRRAEVLKRAAPAVVRDARSLAAIAQKELAAPDKVLLELERRRILREEENLNVKVLEALKLVP